MGNNIKTDTNSSGPINLDSDQLQELDNLIKSLKKEVVIPGKKMIEESASSKADHG